MASSDVAICKLALGHVGSTSRITSIDPPDGSVEAGHCATFYPIARQELIENHSWSFAKKRVALSLLVDNPSTVWTYAYAKPSDMLKPKRVLTASVLSSFVPFPFTGALCWGRDTFSTERGSADYEIEGDVLLTHEPDAVLLYIADVLDVSKYTAGFTSALALLLGSYLAGPIVKGAPGIRLGLNLRQAHANVVGAASANDANSSSERSEFIPASLRSRG